MNAWLKGHLKSQARPGILGLEDVLKRKELDLWAIAHFMPEALAFRTINRKASRKASRLHIACGSEPSGPESDSASSEDDSGTDN